MTFYDRISGLGLTIDSVRFELNEREVAEDFTRYTTTITMEGDGCVGRGEDVVYVEDHQRRLQDIGPELGLEGEYDGFDAFSQHVADIDLFAGRAPDREDFRHYRRWGIESAALDLALLQEGTSLAGAMDRTYMPLRFLVSPKLGDPPSTDRMEAILERHPDMEFKVDADADWDADFIQQLRDLDAVRIIDLKGLYPDDEDVTQPADPELYDRLTGSFPHALLEDPCLTAQTRPVFKDRWHRVSWDVPVESLRDVLTCEHQPRFMNIKPSRFGSVRSLLDTIEHCLGEDIQLYGGGQFELGVGRQHIHAIASLFYPDGPNDTAPNSFNRTTLPPDTPGGPLRPPEDPQGLGWGSPDTA